MKFSVRSRLFIQNDHYYYYYYYNYCVLVLLSKIEFCGVHKQNGKLVFSKSGVFHIWLIVSSAGQRQNVVNFHKLVRR